VRCGSPTLGRFDSGAAPSRGCETPWDPRQTRQLGRARTIIRSHLRQTHPTGIGVSGNAPEDRIGTGRRTRYREREGPRLASP